MNLSEEEEKELRSIIKSLEYQQGYLQYNIDKIKDILDKNKK